MSGVCGNEEVSLLLLESPECKECSETRVILDSISLNRFYLLVHCEDNPVIAELKCFLSILLIFKVKIKLVSSVENTDNPRNN